MFSATDADLSRISENSDLYVSDVILQKAYIEVDEEGSEAAAASGLQEIISCYYLQPISEMEQQLDRLYFNFPAIRSELVCEGETMEMTADRPFYYQIIDEDRNLIIFTGVVVDPTA